MPGRFGEEVSAELIGILSSPRGQFVDEGFDYKALNRRADRSPETVRNPWIRLRVFDLDVGNGIGQSRGTINGDAIYAVRRQRSETLQQRLLDDSLHESSRLSGRIQGAP